MTKARNAYIYQLVGRINSKNKRVSKDEKYSGTYYWQLNIACENKPQVEKIMAFSTALKNPQLWKSIENSAYLDKKYIFFCKNYRGSYRLLSWEELNHYDQ